MSATKDCQIADVAVIGGGPAALAAALAVAKRGRRVTLLIQDAHASPNLRARDTRTSPDLRTRDTRTTAILGDGITFLQNLGVWDALLPQSAALMGIRIVDDRGGWLSAPEVLFKASEMDRHDFGYNVPNEPLRATLLAAAHAYERITVVATSGVTAILSGANAVVLKIAENVEFRVQLVIAADGRNSPAREAAGIATRRWSYPQVAIAGSFGHALPHGGISTELHRRAGPLTTVPLPDTEAGPQSSLVWIEAPDEAARLMALDDTDFRGELEVRLRGLSGPLRSIGQRGTFAIAGQMAVTPARNRIVLAGEAAHVVPPIGAQGLNLGFRDAAAIADAVADASSDDAGAPSVLDAYGRARAADLVSREIGIDLLNRSLLVDFLPVQALRGLGLHALANSRTLRRAAMAMGLSAPGAVPQLMRPSP